MVSQEHCCDNFLRHRLHIPKVRHSVGPPCQKLKLGLIGLQLGLGSRLVLGTGLGLRSWLGLAASFGMADLQNGG